MNKATISADIVSSTELTQCALSQLQSEIKGLVGVLNEGGVKMSDIEAVNATQGIDVSDDVFQPSQNSADKALLDDFLK